jgi:hypothetical protein
MLLPKQQAETLPSVAYSKKAELSRSAKLSTVSLSSEYWPTPQSGVGSPPGRMTRTSSPAPLMLPLLPALCPELFVATIRRGEGHPPLNERLWRQNGEGLLHYFLEPFASDGSYLGSIHPCALHEQAARCAFACAILTAAMASSQLVIKLVQSYRENGRRQRAIHWGSTLVDGAAGIVGAKSSRGPPRLRTLSRCKLKRENFVTQPKICYVAKSSASA